MSFLIQKMMVEEFADFEAILGQRIIAVNGMYWTQVRALFYRPLLPYQEYHPGLVKPPFLGLFGGFQHGVHSRKEANSSLNLLIFKDAETYSVDSLDYNRKRQVKQAAKKFVIRPVVDVNEFMQEAYPVYLSFYERTQYQHGSQRRSKEFFCHWAKALFQIQRAFILGGYCDGRLCGISVSLLVEETLIYAMFFCDTESLRVGLSDLMLHSVRESVANGQYAKQIFAGYYKGGNGLDDFYRLRGCKLVKMPAMLHLNPVTGLILKHLMPKHYVQLKGEMEDDRSDPALEPGMPAQESGIQIVCGVKGRQKG